MNIKIRHVEKLKDAYGITSFPTNNRAVITISRQLNRLTASYGATVLHEMLHVWIRILAIRGFETDDETEHKFIYAAERAVIVLFRKIVGKKKGRKN